MGAVLLLRENLRSHLSCRIGEVARFPLQASRGRNTRKTSQNGRPGIGRIRDVLAWGRSESANSSQCPWMHTEGTGRHREKGEGLRAWKLLIWTCFGERWRHSRL